VTFPLTATGTAGDQQRLSGPVRLIELELAAPSVQDIPNADEPNLPAEFDVTFFDARVGDRPIELGTTWEVVSTSLYRPLEQPSVGLRAGAQLTVSLSTGRTQVARTAFVVQIGTAAFGSLPGSEVPVAVTPGLLEVTELGIGDTISGRVPGAAVTYRIAAVVPAVPFAVDEDLAILADLETVNIDRWSRSRRTEPVDEWAISADAADAEALDRILAGPPFAVMSFEHRVDTARTLSREPVTVGLSGSLGLALAASLVIATVGLILTAVVGGRERRPAFAVLRAMGVRASELRRWLVLETVPLVGVSAAVGLVAGIVLVRLSLDSLAVARDGSPAVPGPVLAIPWATLSVILAVALVAGTALPVVTARLLRRHRTADDLRIGETT